MNALFKKPSIGNQEMSKIQKEISPLDHDVRYLSSELPRRFVAQPGRRGDAVELPGAMSGSGGSHVGSTVRRALSWESRLFDYLPGGSFQSSRPRRQDRRLRRNRTIAFALFGFLWAYWLLARFG